MKKFIVFLLLLFLTSGCSAQEKDGSNNIDENQNKPLTKVLVNKEYDENGNLIRYDSTYSYFYSNIEGDSTLSDSIFSSFQEGLFNAFPDIQRPFFDDMFFEDSLLTYDFYKDDFFENRFKLNMEKFNKLFERMDAFKNKFYKKYNEPKKEDENK